MYTLCICNIGAQSVRVLISLTICTVYSTPRGHTRWVAAVTDDEFSSYYVCLCRDLQIIYGDSRWMINLLWKLRIILIGFVSPRTHFDKKESTRKEEGDKSDNCICMQLLTVGRVRFLLPLLLQLGAAKNLVLRRWMAGRAATLWGPTRENKNLNCENKIVQKW